jgi:hypothetical protein
LAQDMPPLPSDAPASSGPAKDNTMPSLPDAGVSAAAPASSAPGDMSTLPGSTGSLATPADNGMPPLPGSGTAPNAAAPASSAQGDMPALPGSTGISSSADNGMPPLPGSGTVPNASPSTAPGDMPPLPGSTGSNNTSAVSNSGMTFIAVGTGNTAPSKSKRVFEKQPWKESKVRPNAIFGGWIKAKGGNIMSKLAWTSQQVLNSMDAKKYKMANEEGVYEGEENKGSQYRKFTFNVPESQDTVFVLLKQVGKKVWLRVGPDEEPAPADHTYAQVAKIGQEGLRVIHILKAKFGARMAPHHMVPSWDAKFNRQRETADE